MTKLIKKYQQGSSIQTSTLNASRPTVNNPEYDKFLHDVTQLYQSQGLTNYRNFQSQLPEGYTIDDAGIITDKDGNIYTTSTNYGPRFQIDKSNPLSFTFNQGKPIERNVNFYRIVNAPARQVPDTSKQYYAPRYFSYYTNTNELGLKNNKKNGYYNGAVQSWILNPESGKIIRTASYGFKDENNLFNEAFNRLNNKVKEDNIMRGYTKDEMRKLYDMYINDKRPIVRTYAKSTFPTFEDFLGEPIQFKYGGKLIPKAQQGTSKNFWDRLDNFVENKVEPWSIRLGLAGAGVGVGTAATGIGAPAGGIIYTVSQVPAILVDGYQTIRSGIKGDWGDAAYNAAELGLDLFGLKAAKGLSKGVALSVMPKKTVKSGKITSGVTHHSPRVRKHYAAMGKSAYQQAATEAIPVLVKRGVNPSQGVYFTKKLNEEIIKGVTAANKATRMATQQALENPVMNRLFYPIVSQGVQLPFNIYDMEQTWSQTPKKQRGGKIKYFQTGGYIVKSGDNLSTIAKNNNTTVNAIISANPGINADRIYPGQTIYFTSNPTVQQTSNPTVQQTIVNTNNSNLSNLYNGLQKIQNKFGTYEKFAQVYNDTILPVYNYLLSKNFTKEQAAGILGNILQESAFDQNARGGLTQFRGVHLKNYNSLYSNPTWQNHIDYISDWRDGKLRQDRTVNYNYRNNNYKNANHKTARDSAAAFYQYWEAPGTGDTTLQKRQDWSDVFYNWFK